MQFIVPLGRDTPLESYSLSPYQLRPPKVRPHESHRHTAVNTLETFIHLLLLWEFFWIVKIIWQKVHAKLFSHLHHGNLKFQLNVIRSQVKLTWVNLTFPARSILWRYNKQIHIYLWCGRLYRRLFRRKLIKWTVKRIIWTFPRTRTLAIN